MSVVIHHPRPLVKFRTSLIVAFVRWLGGRDGGPAAARPGRDLRRRLRDGEQPHDDAVLPLSPHASPSYRRDRGGELRAYGLASITSLDADGDLALRVCGRECS
jgi:hypothetical protein